MDMSPKPMKDFRPVEIVDNAADQLWKTHQAPYEARAKPSRDRVQAVENHNRACPRLQDELQKRRSISKVTTDKASKYATKLSACENSTSRKHEENNTICRRKDKTIKTTNKKAKIEKGTQRRYLNKRKNVKSMIGTCPRCLSALRRDQMPFRIKRSIENIFKAKEFDKSQSEITVSLRPAEKTRPTNDQISVASSNYPDTSNQSFVSYHSFASMDKEPMVD